MSELLALGGRYRALYDLQLRPEDERPHDRRGAGADVDRRTTTGRRPEDRSGRPTKAVVGSHAHRGGDLRQGLSTRASSGASGASCSPYRRQDAHRGAAVLAFTLTQLAIPLIIRYAIDHGMAAGGRPLGAGLVRSRAFAAAILVNYAAS